VRRLRRRTAYRDPDYRLDTNTGLPPAEWYAAGHFPLCSGADIPRGRVHGGTTWATVMAGERWPASALMAPSSEGENGGVIDLFAGSGQKHALNWMLAVTSRGWGARAGSGSSCDARGFGVGLNSCFFFGKPCRVFS